VCGSDDLVALWKLSTIKHTYYYKFDYVSREELPP
jgi:hypothetical protein